MERLDNLDLQKLAHEVASHLPGYTVAPPSDRWRAEFHGPAGKSFVLVSDWNSDRAAVFGCYPRHQGQEVATSVAGLGVAHPRISFRLSRSAAAIAREISRRFLPAYEDLFERCRLRVAEYVDHERGRSEATAALCQVLGVQPWRDRGATVHCESAMYGSFEPTSKSSIEIKLHGVPLDIALEIARMVRKSDERGTAERGHPEPSLE